MYDAVESVAQECAIECGSYILGPNVYADWMQNIPDFQDEIGTGMGI